MQRAPPWGGARVDRVVRPGCACQNRMIEVAVTSERGDRGRLGALLALADLEADTLTLVEGLVALGLDRGEVDEQVIAALGRGDEPEALVGVEPLDGAFWHVLFPVWRT